MRCRRRNLVLNISFNRVQSQTQRCDFSVRTNTTSLWQHWTRGRLCHDTIWDYGSIFRPHPHGKHKSRKTQAWSGKRRLWMSKRLCCPRPEDFIQITNLMKTCSALNLKEKKETIFCMKPITRPRIYFLFFFLMIIINSILFPNVHYCNASRCFNAQQ